MNKEVDIALLESYLAGDIEAGAVLDVDGNPLSEGALDQAVVEYEDVVIHLEGAALKSRLQEMQIPAVSTPEKRSYRLWYAAAAALLLLITAGLIWQNTSKAPAFDDYFNHFDQLVSFRGEAESAAAKGIEAYSRENYQSAFELLGSLNEPKLNDELKFYLAVSALGSGHIDEAIAFFEELGNTKTNKYYQQTRWYLALAYWQNGQVNKAVLLLQGINAGEFEHEKAVELLSKLSRD